MLAVIKRSDPRILIFAVITILAVIFSIYKAADSLSGTETTPGYRNQPPSAFAQPLPVTLVEASELTEQRLSDQGYKFALLNSRRISAQIKDQDLKAASLRRAGMSPAETNETLRELKGQYQAYRGRETELDGTPSLYNSNADSAEVSQRVQYGPGASGNPGNEFSINYTYQAGQQAPWELRSIDLIFD